MLFSGPYECCLTTPPQLSEASPSSTAPTVGGENTTLMDRGVPGQVDSNYALQCLFSPLGEQEFSLSHELPLRISFGSLFKEKKCRKPSAQHLPSQKCWQTDKCGRNLHKNSHQIAKGSANYFELLRIGWTSLRNCSSVSLIVKLRNGWILCLTFNLKNVDRV